MDSGSGICMCGRERKLEPVFLHCRGVDMAAEGALRVVREMSRTLAKDSGEDLRGACGQ